MRRTGLRQEFAERDGGEDEKRQPWEGPEASSDDVVESRAAVTTRNVKVAYRLATGRLEDLRRRRRMLAAAAAAAGCGGVAANIAAIAARPAVTAPEILLALMAALCALAPLGLCLTRALVDATEEEAVAILVASARSMKRQSEAIGAALDAKIARGAPQDAELESLLATMERGAAAAKEREFQFLDVKSAKRGHIRIRPLNDRTVITTGDGRRLKCQIIDVSRSGIAVEANLPGIEVGALVTIGSRDATATYALPRGMAFAFKTLLATEILDENIVI